MNDAFADKLKKTEAGLTRDDIVWLAGFVDSVLAENKELHQKLARFDQLLANLVESHEEMAGVAVQYTRRVKDLHGDLLAIEQTRMVLRDEVEQLGSLMEEMRGLHTGPAGSSRLYKIRDALLAAGDEPAAPQRAPEAPARAAVARPVRTPEPPAQVIVLEEDEPLAMVAAAPSDGDLGRDVDKWQKMFDASPKTSPFKREPGNRSGRAGRAGLEAFDRPDKRSGRPLDKRGPGLKWIGMAVLVLLVVAAGAAIGIKLSLSWLAK